MELILENFKQHRSLSVRFPKTGLISIKGKSGAGKSSVMEAILEAYYGEADDVVSWWGGNSKVTLVEDSYTIVRTKNPTSLTLTTQDGVFIGEDAQSRINLILGMNFSEFMASSYIKQNMAGSLLSLPPVEQMRFILSLADAADTPTKFKENLNKFAEAARVDLAASQSEIDNLTAVMTDDKKFLDSCSKPTEPKAFKADTTLAEVEELTKANDRNKKGLGRLRAILSSDVWVKLALMDAAKKDFDKAEAEYKNIYAASQPILDKPSPVNAKEIKEKIQQKQEFTKNSNNFKKEIDAFRAEFGVTDAKILPALGALLEAEVAKESAISAEIIKTINENNIIKNTYDCPVCHSPLRFHENNLHTSSAAEPKDVEPLKVAQLDSKRRIGKLTEWKHKLGSMAKNSLNDPLPEETLESLEQKLLIAAADQAVKDKIMADIKSAKDRMDAEGKRYKSSIVEAPKESAEEVSAKIKKVEAGVANDEAKIKHLSAMLWAEAEYKALFRAYEAESKRIQDREESLFKNSALMATAEKKRDDATERAAAAKQLKELADFAVIESCNSIIDGVNENARIYLERFFPDDGTRVLLKNATTKAGVDRPKLGLQVFHKGKEINKLNPLSGGEKSRVYLAYQLALSEMYKSPILLIDEGFSGLPPDHKAECIEYLQEFSENRLVVVIEHGANDSLFQEVINLG